MEYIPKDKVELHLKLGRTLVCFIKIDRYFESLTFDWIALTKHSTAFKIALIRSINEGDAIFNDVSSFETLNQYETDYDEITNPFFIGELAECYQWVQSNYDIADISFFQLKHLNTIYADIAKSGAFDNEL